MLDGPLITSSALKFFAEKKCDISAHRLMANALYHNNKYRISSIIQNSRYVTWKMNKLSDSFTTAAHKDIFDYFLHEIKCVNHRILPLSIITNEITKECLVYLSMNNLLSISTVNSGCHSKILSHLKSVASCGGNGL